MDQVLERMVGVAGFEPATPASRTWRFTLYPLRHRLSVPLDYGVASDAKPFPAPRAACLSSQIEVLLLNESVNKKSNT
jgi:hypothetical protein